MNNHIEDINDKILSDLEFDKVVETLIAIDNMDDSALRAKIKNAIAQKRALRKRRTLWRLAVGASAAAVLIAGVVLIPGEDETETISVAENNRVKLTVPDGRSFSLTGNDTGNLLAEHDVVMKAKGGTLYVESTAMVATDVAEQASEYNTLTIPRGMQYDIVLNDGTHVWLNSDSHLRFPSSFGAGERRVFVDGEAYFEVARDEQKPFVVDMGAQTVTVLGTEFNVRAYRDESSSVTTLFTGSVKVMSKESNAEALLTPGQQSSINNSSGSIGIGEVYLTDALAWRQNIINLEQRTLEEIAAYLSKIYDVDFTFVNDEARQIRYRGSVTRSGSIDTVLSRLSEVSEVTFTNNGGTIKINCK